MSLLRPAPASTLHVFLRDVYNNVSVEELYDRHSVFIHNIVAKHSGFAPTGPRLNTPTKIDKITTSKIDDKINDLSAKIAELQKQLASKQSAPAKASPAPAEESAAEQKAPPAPAKASPAEQKASPAPAEAPPAPAEESSAPVEESPAEQKESAPAEAPPAPAEASAAEQKASSAEQKESAPAEASPTPAEASAAEQKGVEEPLTDLDVTAYSNELAEMKANNARLESPKLTKNATIATVVLVAIVLAIQMLSGPMENERVDATELVQNITKTLGTTKRPFEYGSQSFMNLKPVQEAILTLEQQQRKQEQMNLLWKMLMTLYNRIVGNQ